VRMGSEADGMAFDAKGNLYVAYRRAEYGSSIVEFGPGLTNERHLPMAIELPQGLLVDRAGNIVVVESAAARVLVYPPGARKPSVTVQLPRSFGSLVEAAMRNRERTLWVDNVGGQVFSMPYPLTPRTKPTLYDGDDISSGGMTVSR
jgi:sugar lactone lactonase YvrE